MSGDIEHLRGGIIARNGSSGQSDPTIPGPTGSASSASVERERGCALLDDLHHHLGRFVAFPTQAAQAAVALWILHAHLIDHFETTPRLALLSPEPGSGKTRTLEVLEGLVPRPMFNFSATPATIFRSLAKESRTLLFDEVDAVFTKRGKDGDAHEDLRALLNAGYRRGATIPRCEGPRHDVQEFPAFAALVMAGLGDLPNTIMDRSIILRMRRRAPTERVEQYRIRRQAPEAHGLRDRAAAWATTIDPAIGEAWPDMPPGVEDRAAELWEPLLAIADAVGDHWPQTARTACVELLEVAQEREVSLGIRLLADLRTVFAERDVMSTADVLESLSAMDEAPWGDLYGKGLGTRTLARMLKGYGISSTKVKIHGTALQGYRREALWDAWQRYLPSLPAEMEPPEPAPLIQQEARPGRMVQVP